MVEGLGLSVEGLGLSLSGFGFRVGGFGFGGWGSGFLLAPLHFRRDRTRALRGAPSYLEKGIKTPMA